VGAKKKHPPALVKVVIRLPGSHDHGIAAETMWAEPVGPDRYQLRNTPFYAYGYSFEDVVECRGEDRGRPVVGRVAQRGGHSTFRLMLAKGVTKRRFDAFWKKLAEAGCGFEKADARLYAVDIPPKADLEAALGLLQDGEDKGLWAFEEAHLAKRKET
jgi:hypothetical protein